MGSVVSAVWVDNDRFSIGIILHSFSIINAELPLLFISFFLIAMILIPSSIHYSFILFLTLCFILLYTSLLDSLSPSIQCLSNQHYLKITKKTTFNAKRESFLILSESTVLFSSPPFSNNQQYVFELCLNSSSTHIYTLLMRDTGTGWNLGTWIVMSDINDNTLFTGFMKPHTQQDSYQFALYSPIIKNGVWKYSDSYHSLCNDSLLTLNVVFFVILRSCWQMNIR